MAGVEGKIKLHFGDATLQLQKLIDLGTVGAYDFVFIDADKTQYDVYYEKSMLFLKPGGFMLIDNVLKSGNIVKEENCVDLETIAIKRLNEKIHRDDRVKMVMLPVFDGITIVVKN